MSKKLIQAAAGAGGESVYVEDVFSTYLYDGTGSNININNGIDLEGEGGMVWFKTRSTANGHNIYDTERGDGKLQYITTEPTYTNTNTPWNPTSTGFNTGRDYGGSESQNGSTTVSWTFRKQAGFFDVVTWTGDGSTTTHSHNLGSTPAVIIVKRTDSTSPWSMYHKDATDTVRTGADLMLYLNTTAAATYLGSTLWAATDSTFTTASGGNFNASGGTYVAYLFAHDDQSFGDNSDESIIKCGSFTTDGSGNATVNLGWEPQFFFHKRSDSTGSWYMYDVSRSWTAGDGAKYILYPNLSNAENQLSSNNNIQLTSTGFNVDLNANQTDIYIAIRRPMKTPEAGTDVFSPYAYQDTTLTSGSGTASNRVILNGGVNDGTNFPVDLFMAVTRTGNHPYALHVFDRLRGKGKSLLTNATTAEPAGDGATNGGFDFQEGVDVEYNGFAYYYTTAAGNRTLIAYFLKRATGFFDMVAYTGTGSATTITHNLGVVPELMIVKQRSGSSESWTVWNKTIADSNSAATLWLNSTSAVNNFANRFNSTAPTASVFSVAGDTSTNGSGSTYIAYLFATLAGVSKVGSYSGTGSNVDVDCGFSAGARFVLIKRTDSTGDWYYWDSARGIISGNDPYQLANSTAAEVTSTDYIDPLSSGFTVTSSAPAALNASGGTYIFLAIA